MSKLREDLVVAMFQPDYAVIYPETEHENGYPVINRILDAVIAALPPEDDPDMTFPRGIGRIKERAKIVQEMKAILESSKLREEKE